MSVHRTGVVGCGALARGWHLPNIRANARTELVATCDADATAAEECCQQFGARRFSTDWHDVVTSPDVDVIVLATHTNLRGELIIPALKAGKPVYVEKPLAASLPEMLDILHIARETGTPACVGHNRRSSPAILDLKRWLDAAITGEGGWLPSIDRSRGGQRQSLPEEKQIQILMRVHDDCRSWKDWIYHDRQGILFAEMVHFIDIAWWLNPSPPVRVFAEGSARGNFTLVLRFQDGSLTTIQHAITGHFDYPKELIEVSANHVTLAMDNHVELRQRGLPDEPFRHTYPYHAGSSEHEAGGIEAFHQAVSDAVEEASKDGSTPAFVWPEKGHFAHLDRFLDCIEGRGENPCCLADAVVVTRLTLKLLESIRLGHPLAVGPEDWHIPQT